MLQTKIISEDACAVSWGPDEILVRKRGRDHFGKERMLVQIRNGKLIVNCDVAREFGITIELAGCFECINDRGTRFNVTQMI